MKLRAARANDLLEWCPPAMPGLMRKMVYRFSFFLLLLFSASSVRAQNQTMFWPEIDTYVNLNSTTRFFFISALSSDQDTRQVEGEFGPNFDFFVKPILRSSLRTTDPGKSKYLTFRVGYRYMPELRGDSPAENRIITEATGRFYLPWSVLLTDRNRIDLRYIQTKPFSWRYRNRISLERNFAIRGYTFTPYIRGELYYDSRYNKIAKNTFTIGSVFPMTKHTEAELYYEDQRDSSSTPNYHVRGPGVVLNLFF